jgi:hypothetical protein
MLCIDDNIFTKVFIFYDVRNKCYEIRGKNMDNKFIVYQPFSFTCSNADSLFHFIYLHFGVKNSFCNISLYNYDHLPEFSYDITYEFLESSEDKSYEICAYEQFEITKKDCKKLLNILKNMVNYY